MKFEWSESYETGNEEIDAEHKELFRVGNQFFSQVSDRADKDSYVEALNFLVQYVKNHFSHEVRLMKSVNYPLLETHVQDHVMLTKRLVSIYHELIDRGVTRSLESDIVDFIQSWFVKHIYQYDFKLAEHIEKRKKWMTQPS